MSDYLERGMMYFSQGDFKKAASEFYKGIEESPDDSECYYYCGMTNLILSGEDDSLRFNALAQANVFLTRAIALGCNHDEVYYYRGCAYMEAGDFDLAIRDFTTSINRRTMLPESLDFRGFGYLEKGQFSKAKADFVNALDAGATPERALIIQTVMLEIAQESESTHNAREPIPDDVKMFVWNRDGGRCVKCGSQTRLEFDHIIPVSNGGSSTARNIQLLCESCNRSKSDSIT